MPDMEIELMGIAEVAELLRVTRQRADQLRDNSTFPRPVANLRCGTIWNAEDIRAWALTWQRLPGRPRRGRG